MSEGECFLRSGAEKRAPKKREVKAEGRSDMPVAFHGGDHNPAPEGRQGAEKRSNPDLFGLIEIFRDFLCHLAGRRMGAEKLEIFAIRAHQEDDRGMVHRVVGG